MRKAGPKLGRTVIALGLALVLLSGCEAAGTALPPGTLTPVSSPGPIAPATTPSVSVGTVVAPVASATSSKTSQATVFALLADNRLVAVKANDGTLISEQRLAPAPPVGAGRELGHFLATSQDGKTLFALVSGGASQDDQLAVVDIATARLRAIYTVANTEKKYSGLQFATSVYRSLSVGPQSGKLYLFGTRAGSVIVTVFNPDTGAEVQNWTARPADSYEWWVWQGGLTDDEKSLLISYHGGCGGANLKCTGGLDWLDITANGLQLCQPNPRPGTGCLGGAHGSFMPYRGGLLVATGEAGFHELNRDGSLRRIYDPILEGNHLMEFVVDKPGNLLYSVGSCGYRGGFSALELRPEAGGIPATVVVTSPGQWEWVWRNPPAPPKLNITDQGICGDRLALGPKPLLVVSKSGPVAKVGSYGTLLFIDVNTGQELRKVDTPAEPVDVIVST